MPEYNCYQYTIELGFTEAEARLLQASKCGKGQDATVLRRLAKAKGLPSIKPKYPMPAQVEPPVEPPDEALAATPSLAHLVGVPVARVKRKRATGRRATSKR